MSAVAHIDEYKTGRFYTDQYRGDMSWNGYENNNLLRNEGCDDEGVPRFSDVAMALGADDQKDARGVAIADFDNDGDLDLAINHNIGDHEKDGLADAVLLRNDIGDRRPWLAVELEGTLGNRDAVGATVVVKAGDLQQLRLISAGSSYASQQSRRLYFGLDDHERVDRLIVRWPNGQTQELTDLEARRVVRIREGGEPRVAELPAGRLGAPSSSGEAVAPTPSESDRVSSTVAETTAKGRGHALAPRR